MPTEIVADRHRGEFRKNWEPDREADVACGRGFLVSGDDAIFLAGEHLSILQGWQEGAILSAYNAIDGIVAQDAA